MKQGTTQLLKFKKLKRRLCLPEWQAIGLLEAVWKCTIANAPAGNIGKISNEDIATAIEWDDDPDELIKTLVDTGWLDDDPTHRLVVHNWKDHVPNWLKGNFVQHGRKFVGDPTEQSAKQVAKDYAKESARDGATKSSQVKPGQVNSSQAKVCSAATPSPAEPAAPVNKKKPSEHAFPEFPTVQGSKHGPTTWVMSRNLFLRLQNAFPAVDVSQQARSAHAWTMANLTKRKTSDGMEDFIRRWMAKEQNRGSTKGLPASPPISPLMVNHRREAAK